MISNDVNVIFSFLDKKHIHHSKSKLFVHKNKRRKYIMLNKVMHHFITTYKDYIINVGRVIVKQVVLFKESRKKSPVKTFSNEFLIKMVELELKKEFENLLTDFPNVTVDVFLEFKDLLLSYFSIPKLYHEEESIGEFREKFIEKARDFAVNSLNEFVNDFKRTRTMKLSDYKTYDEHLKKIKMKDYEDKKICAELFSFGEEQGTLKFLTFDKTFKNYLKKHGQKHNINLVNI